MVSIGAGGTVHSGDCSRVSSLIISSLGIMCEDGIDDQKSFVECV